ncbi:MAG: hypothetical protein IMX01_05015 [Limnochordaceae bacterium]|nr:hypothetical protein [Limnochordaceae bacterium]
MRPADRRGERSVSPVHSWWRTVGRLILGVSVVTASSLAMSPWATAGVEVSPARLWVQVRPGEWLPPVHVVNHTERAIQLTALLGPGGHDETGTPLYQGEVRTPEESAYPLRVLVHPLQLEPGATALVSIQVLADAQRLYSGGLYPILYLKVSPAGDLQPDSPFRIAIPVLVTWKDGPPPADVTVLAAGLDRPESGDPAAPVRAWVRVQNQGLSLGQVQAHFRLEDSVGHELAQAFCEPQTSLVLPGYTRRLVSTPWAALPAGREAQLRVTLWVDGHRLPVTVWPVAEAERRGGGSDDRLPGQSWPTPRPEPTWEGRLQYIPDLPGLPPAPGRYRDGSGEPG